MPETLHRGPRYVEVELLSDAPASRVLMPELLGRVFYLARRAVDGSQNEVADLSYLPPSTVSKLELGAVSAAVYQLDALSNAITKIASQAKVPDPVRWDGWEFHHVAALLADALDSAGFACIWERSDLVPEDHPCYVRGRDLTALIRRHWPDRYRSRL